MDTELKQLWSDLVAGHAMVDNVEICKYIYRWSQYFCFTVAGAW
jgi:hypothetical protein